MNDYPHWAMDLQGLLEQQPCVLVTLNQIMGSAPRESGCRMIVTADGIHGSIGGGNLEFTAIAQARELLKPAGKAIPTVQAFGLGPALNQCCGGAVNLHFEKLLPGVPPWLSDLAAAVGSGTAAVLVSRIDDKAAKHCVVTQVSARPQALSEEVWRTARNLLSQRGAASPMASLQSEAAEWWLELVRDPRPELYLFGAGHVGQEVAQRIRGLPFRLTWIDQRPDIFPMDAARFATLIATDPLAAVALAKPDSRFVVMTHSHQLDEDICHAIFARERPGWDFAFLGLIGSATKRKRFVHRLKQRGIDDKQLQRLVCPIGLAGIRGKQPVTIAFSLLAQLMLEPVRDEANQ